MFEIELIFEKSFLSDITDFIDEYADELYIIQSSRFSGKECATIILNFTKEMLAPICKIVQRLCNNNANLTVKLGELEIKGYSKSDAIEIINALKDFHDKGEKHK